MVPYFQTQQDGKEKSLSLEVQSVVNAELFKSHFKICCSQVA